MLDNTDLLLELSLFCVYFTCSVMPEFDAVWSYWTKSLTLLIIYLEKYILAF